MNKESSEITNIKQRLFNFPYGCIMEDKVYASLELWEEYEAAGINIKAFQTSPVYTNYFFTPIVGLLTKHNNNRIALANDNLPLIHKLFDGGYTTVGSLMCASRDEIISKTKISDEELDALINTLNTFCSDANQINIDTISKSSGQEQHILKAPICLIFNLALELNAVTVLRRLDIRTVGDMLSKSLQFYITNVGVEADEFAAILWKCAVFQKHAGIKFA